MFQITNELAPRLSTADACLRQYVYLMKSIPFLNQLKEIIELYILRPQNYTVQSIYKELVLNIPLSSDLSQLGDSDDLKPFRYVVDLLNGKLLGLYTLDQHSEIKPVVSDVNLKTKDFVSGMVDWILQKNKTVKKDEQNYFNVIESSSRFSYYNEIDLQNDPNLNPICNMLNSDIPSYLHYEDLPSAQVVLPINESQMCIPYDNISEGQFYDMSNCNDLNTFEVQNKTGKRGRKSG